MSLNQNIPSDQEQAALNHDIHGTDFEEWRTEQAVKVDSLSIFLSRTEQMLDIERKALNRLSEILGKVWNILADGERALNPDADPEYDTNNFDTNNMYDLVRAGVEARKQLAPSGIETRTIIQKWLERGKYLYRDVEEDDVDFECVSIDDWKVNLKALVDSTLAAGRERYARIAERQAPHANVNCGCSECVTAREIAARIRSGQ